MLAVELVKVHTELILAEVGMREESTIIGTSLIKSSPWLKNLKRIK